MPDHTPFPSARRHFPSVRWEEFQALATFEPAGPGDMPQHGAAYVIAFSVHGAGFLLGNVQGRGWCTPSGHIEPGEDPAAAARREAAEEAGAELSDLHFVGHFVFTYDNGATARLPAFAGIVERWGDIPLGSECTEARAAALDELPALYYRWDPLLEAVFAYVAEITFPEPARPFGDRPLR